MRMLLPSLNSGNILIKKDISFKSIRMKQKLSPFSTDKLKIKSRDILNKHKKRSIDIWLNSLFKLKIIDANSINRKHHFKILLHSTVNAIHFWDSHNIQRAQNRMSKQSIHWFRCWLYYQSTILYSTELCKENWRFFG